MSMLFDKYIVSKSRGHTDPDAQYFVLRIDTDPAARYALNAYALHIFKNDPKFAAELLAWVERCESASNTGVEPTVETVGKNQEG